MLAHSLNEIRWHAIFNWAIFFYSLQWDDSFGLFIVLQKSFFFVALLILVGISFYFFCIELSRYHTLIKLNLIPIQSNMNRFSVLHSKTRKNFDVWDERANMKQERTEIEIKTENQTGTSKMRWEFFNCKNEIFVNILNINYN